jgi:hypothetical protein
VVSVRIGGELIIDEIAFKIKEKNNGRLSFII